MKQQLTVDSRGEVKGDGLHEAEPIAPECEAANVALNWSWVDYMLCALLIVGVVCLSRLAYLADDSDITKRDLFSMGVTVGVCVGSVASVFVLDSWRGKK